MGRESEEALIEEQLARVVQGEGQVLGISGEAGIGKSRIAAELARMARDQGAFVVEGECQSYAVHASYMVWKGIWRGLLGLDSAAKAEVQLDALEMRLKRIDPRLSSRMPLLSPLLDVAIPDNDLTRSFDARLRKVSLEALLIELLRAREHTAAQALYDSSLIIRRKLGDKAQSAALLSNLGIVARSRGDCAAARGSRGRTGNTP